MKTFFVTAYLGEPHGSAKSARDFARALLAVHDDVHIVSPLTEDFGTVAAGHNLSAPVWHRYPRRNAKGSKWPRVLSSARNVFRRMGIRRAMGGQIVIVNGWASYAYWKELAVTGYKSASIIVRESPRHFLFGEHSVSLDEMLAAFSRFDSLVFVSGRTRESWKSFPCLAEKPTFTLPNCCEEEEIECLCQSDRQEARHRAGFSDGDFVVICPGHIEKRKGHDMVLDILPELVSDIPNLCLVMLGDAVSGWAKSIVHKVDSGGYGSHVLRIPSQPSALEYLYTADALLFPSRAESLPRTILEGMAFGMPIIASNVDGIPELIEDGISGCLFGLDNPGKLKEGLSMLVNNTDVARSWGEAAKRRYYERFSRRRQIDRAKLMLDWLGVNAATR